MQIAGSEPPPLPDPVAALRGALARPLGAPSLLRFVEPGDRVAIVAASETLDFAGPELEAWCRRAGSSEVVVLEAGEAPPGASDEHEAGAPAGSGGWRALGWTSAGIPRVAPAIARADKLLLCGVISFHPLAGFGGGGLLLEALASPETAAAIWRRAFAGPSRHPQARAGVLRGNPVQEALGELLALAPPAFLVELAFQRGGRPAAVFAGDPAAAHGIAADFLLKWHAAPLDEPFDWVVAEASGRSLADLLPAFDMAGSAVRPGGVVIVRTTAADGRGERGHPALLAPMPHPGAQRILVSEEATLREEAAAAGLLVAESPDEALAIARGITGEAARVASLSEPSRTLPLLPSEGERHATPD